MTDLSIGCRIGPRGLEWIEKSLRDGLQVSHAFLRRSDLETFDPVALVPPNASSDAIARPERGGVMSVDEGIRTLAEFLRTQNNSEGSEYGLLVEDETARVEDEWLHNAQLLGRIATIGTDVYHWLPLREALSDDALETFLAEASSGYPTNMFLVIGIDRLPLTTGGRARNTLPVEIANSAEGVIVAAYDAETFIAATRPVRN